MTIMILCRISVTIPDLREGSCYREVPEYSHLGACRFELGSGVSKAKCCCTLGRGWGENPSVCETCPQNGTSESYYESLSFSTEDERASRKEVSKCELLLHGMRELRRNERMRVLLLCIE